MSNCDQSPSDKNAGEILGTLEESFGLNRPLMQFLRSVPSGYRCHWEGHTFIPLDRYCRAAAEKIEQLQRDLDDAAEDARRLHREKMALLDEKLVAPSAALPLSTVDAARRALACAIVWAMTNQGGYTEDDEKYYQWAKAVVDASPDAVTRDILDAGIAALASPSSERTTPSYRNIAIAAATTLRTLDRKLGDDVRQLVAAADASASSEVPPGYKLTPISEWDAMLTVSERLDEAEKKLAASNERSSDERQLCALSDWCLKRFGVETNRVIGKDGWPNTLAGCVMKAVDERLETSSHATTPDDAVLREENLLLTAVINRARETLLVSIKGTPEDLEISLGKLNLACIAHWDWRTQRVAAASATRRSE
jgi:hypothetical protein